MRNDLLTIVEAAYALDVTDQAWLRGLTDAIGPFIERGMGAYGATLDASDPGRLRLGPIYPFRGQEDMVQAIERAHREAGAARGEVLYRSGAAINGVIQSAGDAEWEDISKAGPSGVGDCSAVCALDPAGRGYVVIAPSAERQRYAPRVKRVWSRVTAHVVAMQRLRNGLPTLTPRAREEGEAVLTPGGKLEHAEGAAKDVSARILLREAAIARERARGRLRKREPDEAVEAWQALVAGRWSIVDRFDHDGRRFLIAHENEPESAGPRALTPREKQVVSLVAMGHTNKLIAYELGLTTDAIGRYLATAIRKLGLTSRVDVVRLHRAAWMSRAQGAKGTLPSRTPK